MRYDNLFSNSLFFFPFPVSFSCNHLTDPAYHPHSSLYLRWRRGALDAEPQHGAATWLWHPRQMCLPWQRILPTITTTQKAHRLYRELLFLSVLKAFFLVEDQKNRFYKPSLQNFLIKLLLVVFHNIAEWTTKLYYFRFVLQFHLCNTE